MNIGGADINVALGEKAENLSQKVAFIVVKPNFPVFDVFNHRNFGPQPMHLLTLHESFVSPRVNERFVVVTALR